MLNKKIHIQNKIIGKNTPCFIAAEIGINHNGNMNLAKKMIQAAKDAGADGVKFQNYHTEDFILDKNLMYEYISEGKKIIETQYEMFKRYELSTSQLRELKQYCDEIGIIFFSTPTSKQGIKDLQDIDTLLFKNGSDFLVNLELIEQFAKTKMPLIISTGMATLAEIDDAVRAFEKAGGEELIILHCISSYPAPAQYVNLKKIPALEAAFNYPIGFSDHTNGIIASLGAVALGACFIEKHFTTDKNLAGPDQHFSANPKELEQLVKAIRILEQSLGSSKIAPTQEEEYGRENFRLSCVAKKNLKKGHVLKREDIAFSRPANGLAPKFIQDLIGKSLNNSLSVSEPILFTHIT